MTRHLPRRGLIALTIAMCGLARVLCQIAGPPAFEVASVKRLPAGGTGGFTSDIEPGALRLHRATLGNCIQWAWDVQPYQIVGPAWIDRPTDVLFDIEARAGNPVPQSQLRVMLQQLLEDRFRLSIHREERLVPIYAMLLAGNGPKFHLTKGSADNQIGYENGITVAKGVTMARLAQMFGPPFTALPVVDRTGLIGAFDFTLDIERYRDQDAEAEAGKGPVRIWDMEPAIRRALSEQLGLKLEQRRSPVTVFVIDHAEKTPTDN